MSSSDSSARPSFDLSAKRKALLEALLVEQGLKQPERVGGPRFPPRPAGPTPLSFAQRRLWFIDQFQPQSALYNIPVLLRFDALDLGTLERTVEELLRRHEVLRTRFVLIEGEPHQEVLDVPPAAIEGIDLDASDLTPYGERQAAFNERVQELVRRPFDIDRGPHHRIAVIRAGAGEQLLVLVLHHIVADGWSTSLLLRELLTIYQAFAAGRPSPLPEPVLQYADFAAWQRSNAGSEELVRDLEYWRATLADFPALLELPIDRQRPAVQSFRGAARTFEIGATATNGLVALCQEAGATLFMGLLAVFAVLLKRSTRQDDLLIGSPIANRLFPEVEGLLGPFANTVVFRVDTSGEPTFRELLARVRETTLGAFAHQSLPFERLVEELHPERDLGRSPIFQVLFVLQNTDLTPRAADSGAQETRDAAPPLEVDTGTAKFDLTISLQETSRGLTGMLEYATDLFDASTAERMVEHFEILLQGAAARPDDPIWRLPLLAEHERRHLLVEVNRTRAPFAHERSLSELFAEQVARTPEAPAVEFAGEVLTYRELDARANQLARRLRMLGVGREDRVGICVERSFDMVIGMLGILKAGGVHTPLDPGYPKERLGFMLEDAAVKVVLVHARLRDLLPATDVPVLDLDRERESLAQESDEGLPNVNHGGDLAYVMFTSGSTGRPKGVAMEHRSMLNLFAWQAPHFAANDGVRTVQFTSYSFDVSVQEILSTLCTSGVLVLMTEDLRRDFPGMIRFLTDRRVERLFLPFTALHQLAEAALDLEVFPRHLRDIVSTGEQMHLTLPVVRFLARLDGCALHNQYGPTETHFATAFPLRGDPHGWPILPPVGRPIANTRIYVLDEHRQPVPLGVPGEVSIGGVMVARGYLARPELTAERFFDDPFDPEPFPGEVRARAYQTGDLARWNSDGQLEYMGRIDQQVKLRGFRIELGEIEAVLIQHPSVRDAVAVVREDTPGDQRLVAYFVPSADSNDGESAGFTELKVHLKKKLPDFMIPSTLVALPALPMTPNGKVDRRALRAPEWARPELEVAYEAPRDEVEARIAAIWCEVLGVPRVGIRDVFFDLGGHSLLATQVVSRLRDAFAVQLPLRTFFETPTVAELAVAITADRRRAR